MNKHKVKHHRNSDTKTANRDHTRTSVQYQDGMELRDRKMTKDCTQKPVFGISDQFRHNPGCAATEGR